jgi:hypothetical protein
MRASSALRSAAFSMGAATRPPHWASAKDMTGRGWSSETDASEAAAPTAPGSGDADRASASTRAATRARPSERPEKLRSSQKASGSSATSGATAGATAP